MSFAGKNTWLRCYQQGGQNGFGYIAPEAGSTWDDCVFIDTGGNSFNGFVAQIGYESRSFPLASSFVQTPTPSPF
jgi:lipid-binding SYLF domain-containing protein